MSKHGKGIAAGMGMVVFGAAMYVVFGYVVDIETPIVGLRQVGAVIAVLGLIELLALRWSGTRKRENDFT